MEAMVSSYGKDMMKICFVPIINNENDFIDIISRVAWYFTGFPIIKIYLFVSDTALVNLSWRVCNGMDKNISNNFKKIREKVEVINVNSDDIFISIVSDSSHVFCWKESSLVKYKGMRRLSLALNKKEIFLVDPESTHAEGFYYIDAGYQAIKNKSSVIDENHKRFKELISTLGKYDHSFLLATGPSVERYKKYDFKNGFAIICNSIIMDEDLMNYVKPQALVFADPIFHFGPSQYAGVFREKLLRSAMMYDYFILLPLRYFFLFIERLPELKDRVIGIPMTRKKNFNLNLVDDFELSATDNILTFMMLPVAATFSNKIGLLGCDGRPVNEDTYFWSHNKKTQINDKMLNIKKIHPAFFNIEYNDYYFLHCKTLSALISHAHSIGHDINCLSHSYIPALDRCVNLDFPVRNKKTNSFESSNYTRVLMLDSTPIGHKSATGQLKKTLLGDWPKTKFLQIWLSGSKKQQLHSITLDQDIQSSQKQALSVESVLDLAVAFSPDVIYFRPIDSVLIFDVAESLLAKINCPLVIHMMDDWPERLKSTDMSKYRRLDTVLRHLIRKASLRLSICDGMSDAYQTRYSVKWSPLANGVDLAESPSKDWSKRLPVDEQSPFLIRYMGALADDMTYSSVRDIAIAVSNMQSTHMVRFEIYTMDWCRLKAEQDIGKYSGVSIHPLVDSGKYKPSLAEADALVIAYNFDPKSISYIRLSLANKMPECLASGVPLLAYGPSEVATIRYLKEVGCVQVVEKRDEELLTNSIKELVGNLQLCRQLGEKGRTHTAEKLSKQVVQNRFRKHIYTASKLREKEKVMSSIELGPFRRDQHAHYDETDCIAELYKEVLHGETMIDVGAHHGWAHAPFLEKGWRIYAFEPDNKNRAKLLERLAKHKNRHLVTLESRGVSNKSQQGVSFFTSEQSTGISGLSSFHETHEESQKVDITTLTEFFQGKEMPDVDFLKIDTEGHDLFVLQGFPWERNKPAVVECEFEDSKTVPLGYTFHDLAHFLTDKDYTVYVSEWHPIIRYGVRHDWRQLMRYPCELADPKGWGNLIAFREPLDENKLITAINKLIKVEHELPTTSKVKNIPQPPEPKVKYLGFDLNKNNTKHFTYINSTKWHYHHSSSKQRLWIASTNIKQSKGLTFDGGIALQSDDSMTISISLGRSGNGCYEGSAKKIKLSPKVKQHIKLSKTFSHEHSGLKLQLDILDTEKETTTLVIEDLYIHESLGSIEKLLGKENITLTKANELMRKGDYQSAKNIYSLLERKSPLRIYAENIKLAEYKLISQNKSYRNVK